MPAEETISKYKRRRKPANPAKPRKKRQNKPKDKRPYLFETAIVELNIDPQVLLPTISAYTDAFNTAAKAGYKEHLDSFVSLHGAIYEQLRNSSPLSSQLVCSALGRAAEALKAGFTKDAKHGKTNSKKSGCPHSAFCSVRYDERSFSLKLNEKTASITTLEGRKVIPFTYPSYYDQYFDKEQEWRYASSDLVYKKHLNRIFLHITFKKLAPVVEFSGSVFAADRGIYNIITAGKADQAGKVSQVQFHGGRKLKEVKGRYKRLRAELQSIGTKSAKRHLKRMSGKEKRFVADTNHCVSKKVVAALKPGDVLVLEKLTGLKEKKANKKNFMRRYNSMISGWSYFQQEQFLGYKALAKGVRVLFVDPAWSSITCPKKECSHCDPGNRNGNKFCCLECGYKGNADFIAIQNLAAKGWGAICSSNQVKVKSPNEGAEEVFSPSMSGSTACISQLQGQILSSAPQKAE